MGTGLGCAGETLIKTQGDLIKSRCGSRQSSHHPFDTHPHPLHIYIYIFVYTQLDPVRMVMEVTAMMQNMYTYTIQVYALVLTVK